MGHCESHISNLRIGIVSWSILVYNNLQSILRRLSTTSKSPWKDTWEYQCLYKKVCSTHDNDSVELRAYLLEADNSWSVNIRQRFSPHGWRSESEPWWIKGNQGQIATMGFFCMDLFRNYSTNLPSSSPHHSWILSMEEEVVDSRMSRISLKEPPPPYKVEDRRNSSSEPLSPTTARRNAALVCSNQQE